jgi:hypothetical protein
MEIKNKKVTYVLGVAVVLLWGLIIRMVVIWANGNGDDNLPITAAKSPKEPYNDYAIPKDTARLLLNYRDPFGLVKFRDTAQNTVKRANYKTPAGVMAKPAVNWNFIKYSGYIHNRASRKLIALVSINGKNMMLSEGDTKEQVKLIKNMRDSIRVSYNGQTKFITLKSPAL